MRLQIGGVYTLTYQSSPSMRFKLAEIDGPKVRLTTRNNSFWTSAACLIYTGRKQPKWKRRLQKKENRERLTVLYADSNVDLDPEKTAAIVKMLKSDEIFY